MTSFYLTRGFHPHMSFGPDTTTYKSTQECLQVTKASDITACMEELLVYGIE